MASITDVAAAAGVSVATVSRVLSNYPHVRPAVRARVLAAVQQLDYQPSRVARSLRLQRSQVFGLIIPDIQNPFFTELARAVEDVAYRHEHAVFLCNTDENAEKEKLYVDLMEAEQVAGVIIAPTVEADSPCRWLLDAGIPVVAVDRRLQGLEVDTVLADNAACATAVTTHLIDEGFTRIAAIVGPSTTTTGRERLSGFRSAMEAARLAWEPENVRSGPYTEEMGAQLMLELLNRPQPPQAILVANNLLGTGALAAIRQRSLSIPGDVALAVIGETPCTRLATPPLTAVKLPIYDMGVTAVTLLLERMANRTSGIPAAPREVVHNGRLVLGLSSLGRSLPGALAQQRTAAAQNMAHTQ
jgi:DNA-binding LacI/PurR family transcriptional regulator